MNNCIIRQSNQAIQPWNDESSNIPNRFLRGSHMTKTLTKNKSKFLPKKQIQVLTKSVYFIQNNQEEECSKTYDIKKITHKTCQNSPLVTSKKCINDKNNLEANSIAMRTAKTVQRSRKKMFQQTLSQQFLMKTKKTMIQFKMANKSKLATSQGFSCAKRINNKDATSNLLKIYEKSTFYNENIKDTKQLIGLGSISIQHKFKTKTQQSQNQKGTNNFLQRELQIKDSNSLYKINATKIHPAQHRFSQSRAQNIIQNSQKVKFELLLERKLFLLKNDMKQCQIKQAINKRLSKVINN